MASISDYVLSPVATQRYQRLSTTITDYNTGTEAAFAVYPSATRPGPDGPVPTPHFEDELLPAIEDLGFARTEPSDEALQSSADNDDTWIRAIAAALDPALLPREEVSPGVFQWRERVGDIWVPSEEMAFAKYLYGEKLLPWRNSPIAGRSLAELVGKASGAGAGGIVGVYEGINHGLLVLLTAPGGMLIGGTAMGVATALERGLHERVLKLIVPPSDDGGPAPVAEQPSPTID